MNPVLKASDGLGLKPQAKTILTHMRRRGSISPMQALLTYGIPRLAACVYDLREAGIGVKTEMRKDEAGHQYARYSLEYDENGKPICSA